MTTALVFDCDGVLGDTERHGHLPAFNQTFAEFGVPVRWSEREYGELLRIGGGKERMRTVFDDRRAAAAELPRAPAARGKLLGEWHRRKTELFTERVAAGLVPPRPGVRRVAGAALAAGWRLAVASTSAEDSVRAMLAHAVGPDMAAAFDHILAGDIVAAKKPAPDIYLTARDRLGLPPDRILVIEDSAIGSTAAVAAGLRCVITVSDYTRHDRFPPAPLIVSSLGDPDGEPAEVLSSAIDPPAGGFVSIEDLSRCLAWAAR